MIPIAIVAHVSRQTRAEKLTEAVKAEFVSLDNGTLGPGGNHMVAWEWLAENGDPWSVVLEDDAIPVKGFREQLNQVLHCSPDPICSLYLGRGRPPHWQTPIQQVIMRPEHFLRVPELLHHVGVAVRTSYLSSMLGHVSHQNLRKVPIDEAIGLWARRRKLLVSYCHPSIVDHDHALPTMIREHTSAHGTETGRRNDPRQIRRAWAFGTRERWEPSHAAIPPVPE